MSLAMDCMVLPTALTKTALCVTIKSIKESHLSFHYVITISICNMSNCLIGEFY